MIFDSRAGKVGSSTPRQVFIDGALSGYNNPRRSC